MKIQPRCEHRSEHHGRRCPDSAGYFRLTRHPFVATTVSGPFCRTHAGSRKNRRTLREHARRGWR